jgi:hypothetical protein
MATTARVNPGAEYWTVCPVPIQRACFASTKRSPTGSPFATYCCWLEPRGLTTTVALADQKDAQQKFGINRRPAGLAITIFELFPHKGKADVLLNQPQQMILRNSIF